MHDFFYHSKMNNMHLVLSATENILWLGCMSVGLSCWHQPVSGLSF